MTNEQIKNEKLIYIPNPDENFSSKNKGKYIQKVGNLNIKEITFSGNEIVEQLLSYKDETERDNIWTLCVEGNESQLDSSSNLKSLEILNE